jgi:hypothetical protein
MTNQDVGTAAQRDGVFFLFKLSDRPPTKADIGANLYQNVCQRTDLGLQFFYRLTFETAH